MTKRNICIDSAQPSDSMRIIATTDSGIGMVMNLSKEVFEFLFDVEAKEGLYLEVDIENVTKLKKENIRALHKKLGLERHDQDGDSKNG